MKRLESPQNQSQHPALPILIVGLILLLALGLRLSNIASASLWIDEIYSLIVANTHLFPERLDTQIHTAQYYYTHYLSWQPMDMNRLLALLKINVHMPLYYLLVNPWMGWFGNHAAGLRSFSALWSTLMILPVFGLGQALGGRRAGYLCALVAALAPFQIYYGQEGRMYALSLFWTACSGLAFWKLLYGQHPWRWAWLYALFSAGGMLSHYMFVFFLGFQFVFGCVELFQSKTRQSKNEKNKNGQKALLFLPALALLTGIAFLWLPVYQMQQQGVNDEYHFAKGWVAWSRYLTVPLWQPLVVMAGDNRLVRAFYFPLTLLSFVGIAWGALVHKISISRKREGYMLAWILGPLFLQIAYDAIKHTHISIIDRYAMLIAPAMCLWVGLALHRWLQTKSGLRPKLGLAVLAGMLFLAIGCVWAPSPFRDEHNKDDNIRQKIRYFTSQAQPNDLIFANGPWGAPNLAAYYLHQSRPAQPMLYWINQFNGQTVPLPKPALLQPYQRVWLFRHRANNERGLQTCKDYLQALYPHVVKTHDWFIYSRTAPASKP
ncbi:hypothetical protein [Vampirovibrio sp.]|uniref:glycosyltransferase family 39 protein n=1 Tax=Vampirovibrio sp. TaxID=2717857 RepID=UPI00359435D0